MIRSIRKQSEPDSFILWSTAPPCGEFMYYITTSVDYWYLTICCPIWPNSVRCRFLDWSSTLNIFNHQTPIITTLILYFRDIWTGLLYVSGGKTAVCGLNLAFQKNWPLTKAEVFTFYSLHQIFYMSLNKLWIVNNVNTKLM